MAAIKTEMPPLHTADGGGGSGNGNGGNGGVSSADGGGSNSATTTTNAVVSSGPHSNSSGGGGVADSGSSTTNGTHNGSNNTISAAADSSDNQPGTPQPTTNNSNSSSNNAQLMSNNEQQQQQQQQMSHMPYGMYPSAAAASANGAMPHMYGGAGSMYASASEMQQQQQHQQQYPSYLNSYEQFYQQQQIGQSADYTQSAGLMYGAGGAAANSGDYKVNSSVRYQPYHTRPPTGSGTASGDAHSSDINRNGTPDGASSVGGGGGASSLSSLTQSSAAVSTTTNSLSPRVVSSSSPTSTSAHMQMGGGGSAAGSPGGGCKLQCKKCGLMCTSDNELQEHITNVHGASPYGSSGYSSSPYIKEELSTGSQQQGQQGQGGGGGGNPGELLDLDSQKMVYPPPPGSIQSLLGHPQQMHDPVGASDPLHSMHSMQQRALPGWETSQPPPNGGMQDAMPSYMHAQPQTQAPHVADMNGKTAAYYANTGDNTGVSIKQEYGLIKSEYPDSQNYVDKSFDPTVAGDMCQQQAAAAMQQQQQTTMMPVSSSPAEFPSTTTGSQDPQQQYRGFEPPTSSSVNTGSLPTKAATWKSNEARRPKTYNCTACNKWFTSSGHLKRHYNTTLHKNAVKSSGQPDPATLPISAHHHPARDPTVSTKSNSRRNNNAAAVAAAAAATAAAAAVAQQNQSGGAPSAQPPSEPTRSPQEFVPSAGMGPMSQYSASPSPTHQTQMNGMAYGTNPSVYGAQQQQQQRPYMNQVQSASASSSSSSPQHMSAASNASQTVLNGHPNGLAGPSAQVIHLPTIPSSRTRGLLNTTTTTTTINNTTTKSEPMEDNYQPNNSNSNSTNKRRRLNSTEQLELESSMSPTQLERSQTDMEVLEQQQPHQLLDAEAADVAAVALRTQSELQQRHRLVQAQQEQVELEEQEAQERQESERDLESYHQHQLMVESLEEVEEQQRRYHNNNTPMLNQAASAHIISRQQYREPVRRPLPMVDSIFSPMHQQMAAAHMQANIMDQAYNLIPLGISNNMLQLQPPPHITTTTHTHNTATTHNMGNIHMQLPPLRLLSPHSSNNHHQHQHNQQEEASQHHQDQLPLPSMRNTPLLNNTNIQSPQQLVDHTIIPHNTITTTTTLQPLPPPITTTTTTIQLPQQPQQQQLQQQQHTINTIQSYQQLQQQASELGQQLEPTLTYHTIIGNSAAAATSGAENAEASAFNTSNAISISSNSNNSDNSSDSSEVLQLTTLDPYGGYQTQTQQMVTADGQILQFMPSALMGQPFIALSAPPPPSLLMPSSSTSTSRITLREAYARSPQEGDLPPVHTIMSHGSNPEYHGFESSQSVSGAYADPMDLYPHTTTTAEQTIITKEEADISADSGSSIEAHNLTSQVTATESRIAAEGAAIRKTTLAKIDSSESMSTTKTNTKTGAKSRRKSTTTRAGSTTKGRAIAKPPRPSAERRTVTRYPRTPIVRSTDPEIKELPGGRLKCMECDKEFSKACYVTQHKASFHRGEYPYRCSKCGKRYQDESKYRVHYERHFTPNKPHKCVLCPKQFHYKTDLRRHIEAKHNEVLPHGCTHCPKGFCRQDHLRKHVDTHNVEHKHKTKAKDLVRRGAVRRVQLEYRTAAPAMNGITKTPTQPNRAHPHEDIYVEDDEDIYDDDDDDYGNDEHMDYTELDVDEGVVVENVVDMDVDMKVIDMRNDDVIYKTEDLREMPCTSQGGAELYDSRHIRHMTRLGPMESLQNLTLTAVAMPLSHNNGMLPSMNGMIIEDRYAHNDDDEEGDGVEEVQEVDGYVIIKKEEKQLSAYF